MIILFHVGDSAAVRDRLVHYIYVSSVGVHLIHRSGIQDLLRNY